MLNMPPLQLDTPYSQSAPSPLLPVPDLHLDPQFAPAPAAGPYGSPGSTSATPHVSFDVPTSLPHLAAGQAGPRVGPSPYEGMYSDPALPAAPPSGMEQVTAGIAGLGTRPGLQVDSNGVGATVNGQQLRVMPYTDANMPSPYVPANPDNSSTPTFPQQRSSAEF